MKNKMIIVTALLAVMFTMTGMAAAANISGMKFNDLNNNGIKDPGELGLANWTIALTAPGQEFPINTLTNGNGNYIFSGLAPGNYTVGEVPKTGWMQTVPTEGTYNVTLAEEDVTGKDFGNFNTSQGPIIVGPVVLNVDLRTLPVERPWKEGDPVIEAPGQPEPVIIGATDQSGTGVNKGEAIQRQNLPASAQNAATVQGSGDPLSAPILNFDGMVSAFNTRFDWATGKFIRTGVTPPDTVGDVGPNHYIQAVNMKFVIFDKSGKLLVGKKGGDLEPPEPAPFKDFNLGVNINQLWIEEAKKRPELKTDPCYINNDGDPIVKYDRLEDRWILAQFVRFSNLCIAVSKTPDPVSGGWNLYDFPSDGIFYDYPKLGVWPDAYYVGTNDGALGGDVWAYDKKRMLKGDLLDPPKPPIHFHAGEGFWLPSDFYGTTLPPDGAPNVFVRFVNGEENHLELGELRVEDPDKWTGTFKLLTPLTTDKYNSIFCGSKDFRVPCIPQRDTTQKLDILNGELMYRLQYRNFGDHETLVLNHADNVGSDLAGIRWYELKKSGGDWSIFQQGTYSPPDATNRWMGSIAMDRDRNMALGYSVSSDTVFPGLRYTGRLASDPLGEMPAGEFILKDGSGSQTSVFSRWGDYSAMSVDPVDDCTFWFTSEYYQTTSDAGWHTRIGNFRFTECTPLTPISGMKFNDKNGNGKRDAGEEGLSGWRIKLRGYDTLTRTIVNREEITDANGNYGFKNVTPGFYVVYEMVKSGGWVPTTPVAKSINLKANETINVNFGNRKVP